MERDVKRFIDCVESEAADIVIENMKNRECVGGVNDFQKPYTQKMLEKRKK